MFQVNFALVNERARLSVQSLLGRWFPNGAFRGSHFHLGGISGEKGDSLQVCVRGEKCGVWKDFNTGEGGGDLISLYAAAFTHGKQLEAAIAIAKELGIDIESDSRVNGSVSSRNFPRKSTVKPKSSLDVNPHTNASVRSAYSKFSEQLPVNYGYFSRKGLLPPKNVTYGTDSHGIFCAVPMYLFVDDNQLVMTSFEKIYNNGNKLRLKGVSTVGCFNTVSGSLEEAEFFYFCEGFATALTVSLVVEQAVVICCFGKQNLKHVLTAFHQRFSKTFSLVCDNDHHTLEPDKAYVELASEFDCVLSFPLFPSDASEHFKQLGIEKYNDWNDFYVGYGLEALRSSFPLSFVMNSLNSISDLLIRKFEPRQWIVEGLIPQDSLNLLSSKPKDGKTWWGLNIAISVTLGGLALGHKTAFPCKQSVVYYLALEDTDFRLHKRFSKLKQGMNCSIPNTLFYETMMSKDGKYFPRIGEGFEQRITKWVSYCRLAFGRHVSLLIIIDTFKMIRPLNLSKGKSFYDIDYESTSALRSLVNTLNVSILLFHHNNKMRFEPGCDPLDAISGSTGLPASVDNNLIFRRPRGNKYCEMYRVGRDYESDKSVVMEYSETYGLWTALDGDFEHYALSGLRGEILGAIREGADDIKHIAEIVARDYFTVQRTVYRMVKDGQLIRKKAGRSFKLSLPNI